MGQTKLCLGTVQFGLNYGINNFAGKPLREHVFAMLDEALNSGITFIDSAAAYGNAEELLGQYGIKDRNTKIISKLRPNIVEENCANVEKLIEEQVNESLARIGIKQLDGYLLHTPDYFYDERIMNALRKCKDNGLIANLGVSIYETQQALDAVSSGIVDYIQIPYSIFDQRVDTTDFFELAQKNKVTVFARSAFLQGLLLMEADKIPAHLAETKGYLEKYDEIIKGYGFNRVQAALLFSYSHPGIDYVVFGVDNIEQLKEDIEISKQEVDFSACREELSRSFKGISKSIIFPSLWAKKK